eukprot:303407-Rhodomonas_salina.2
MCRDQETREEETRKRESAREGACLHETDASLGVGLVGVHFDSIEPYCWVVFLRADGPAIRASKEGGGGGWGAREWGKGGREGKRGRGMLALRRAYGAAGARMRRRCV